MQSSMNRLDQGSMGGSLAHLGSMDSQASLDIDSVREIMDNCSGQISKNGKASKTQKDLAKVEKQKERTDAAMDRLKELYEVYCGQLYSQTVPVSTSEIKTAGVKKFIIDQQNKAKKKKTLFLEKPDALLNDEKSVDLIMRDGLDDECFLDRCFKDPKAVKQQIAIMTASKTLQPKKSKKTKNPIFWKPEPVRMSHFV